MLAFPNIGIMLFDALGLVQEGNLALAFPHDGLMLFNMCL
jgi:hypothetical protein